MACSTSMSPRSGQRRLLCKCHSITQWGVLFEAARPPRNRFVIFMSVQTSRSGLDVSLFQFRFSRQTSCETWREDPFNHTWICQTNPQHVGRRCPSPILQINLLISSVHFLRYFTLHLAEQHIFTPHSNSYLTKHFVVSCSRWACSPETLFVILVFRVLAIPSCFCTIWLRTPLESYKQDCCGSYQEIEAVCLASIAETSPTHACLMHVDLPSWWHP